MNFARKRESFLAGIRTNFLGFWVKVDRYGMVAIFFGFGNIADEFRVLEGSEVWVELDVIPGWNIR